MALSIGKNEEQELRKIMKNELHRCGAASRRLERKGIRVSESFCVSTKEYWLVSMPNSPCPMPNAQCPMPHAPCPMPHAQCPMPNAPVIKYADFLIRFFY
ncbi:hypothetical protein [Nostoc sp.]|uniref:hypothetical protein n=1 Tax=Nostoc sp. TaxID=1180 RepID=UPI002FFD0AB9